MDYAVVFLVTAGVFFLIVGTVGLWRLPDTYSRIQAVSKGSTFGGMLILLGLGLRSGLTCASLKLLLLLGLLGLTNATAAHVLGKEALQKKYPFAEGTYQWNYQGNEEV